MSEKNAREKFDAVVARAIDASDNSPYAQVESWGLVLDGAFTLTEIEAIVAAYRDYLSATNKQKSPGFMRTPEDHGGGHGV